MKYKRIETDKYGNKKSVQLSLSESELLSLSKQGELPAVIKEITAPEKTGKKGKITVSGIMSIIGLIAAVIGIYQFLIAE